MSKNNFTYTLQIDAEIQNLLQKTNQVKQAMQGIMTAGKAPGAEKTFSSIEKAIERLQTKASQPITSVAAFENLQKDAQAVGTSLGKLGTIVENLGKMGMADKLELLPPDLKQKITEANTALSNFSKVQSEAAKKSDELVTAERDLAKAQKDLKAAEGKVSEKKALIDVQKTKVANDKAEADAIKAKIDALKKYQSTNAAYEKAGADKRKAGGTTKGVEGLNLPKDRAAAQGVAQGLGIDLKDTQAVEATLARLNNQYREASKAVTDAEATQRRYSTQLNEAQNAATIASSKINTLETTVQGLNAEFEKNKAQDTQAAYAQLRAEAGRLGVDISNIPLDYTEQNFLELNDAMNQLAINGIAQVDAGMDNIQMEMEETNTAAKDLGNGLNIAGGEVQKLDATVSNTTAFTSRIAQFVGLQGGIQIARRAMRDAINTIKDLDAAMTEMAVVTDLEVGDYWDQLPRHTEDANKLGVAIKDVYEAETLYYQQGLKTNEVIEMSAQTLKMARIAGLSAEDATNKMTAALRGFNMELNETSAERVADVYSQLAAITASDVDEISSAMTKTASIAASAGMEFETTAAFLSQIIETTRESAETAGTALKTVIARFQELKKDPSEIGEVDGEIIDANKIETALRSVGVSLRDAQGQFRELDDVFLELSGKWDSLDTNTQRYIATIAAGSRQQSRFIAMVSDYSRTQELVEAANTSAGASNKQFEKTLDSLESKLNELKNAWNTFTMGITNSEILKAGIDILTWIITKINEATELLGDFSSAAKIGLLVAALYLGDKALNTFTLSLRGGKSILASFGEVGRKSINQLKLGFAGLTKQIKKLSGQKVGVDIAPATAAMQNYTKATQNQVTASKMRQTIENNTALSAEARATKMAALDNIQIANEKRKTQAVAEYAAAKGLTIEQAGVAMALQSLGIAEDVAEAAALGGLTLAKIADYKASMVAQGLDDKEIAMRMKKIIAIYAEAGAEKTGNTQKKISIALIWAKIKAFVVETATKIANWVAQMALNVAEATGIALTASYVLVVAALVVGLGLLVFAIIAVVKAIVNMVKNSPENQLKSAEEAADAAAEAANRAAEAYNNLTDSMDGLADKYAALEDITRGTQEWRDAVKEVNDEVLDLIEKYPELAPLVESEGGVLKLDLESEEVQNVLEKYEDKASAAASASLAAKINVNEKQATVTSTEISSKNRVLEYDQASESYITRELTDKTMQAMAAALNSGDLRDKDGDGSVYAEMTQWLQENGNDMEIRNAGTFAMALDDNIEALREFGAELYAMSEQERVYKEQMAQNAINAVDASKYTEEQLKRMDAAATSGFADSFTDKYEAEFQKAVDDKDTEAIQSAKEEVAENLYGKDATVSGNTITYKDEEGKEQTKELTDEEFKEQWAAIKATKQMTAAFEQLPKTINSISKKMTEAAGKAFEAITLEKEGAAMTKADIEAQSYTKEEMQAIWGTLSIEEQSAYGDFENLWAQYSEGLEAGKAALAQAQKVATSAGIQVLDDVAMSAAKGYAEHMRNVYLLNEESADRLDSRIRNVMDTLNDTDKTSFISALNGLDWNDVNSIEALPDILEDMDISVRGIDDLVQELIEDTGALEKIDLDKLKETSTTLLNLSGSIRDQSQGRSFSEEDYKALIEMSPELESKFSVGLDGSYVYLGSSMNELTKAIEENTSVQLAKATDQLSNKIIMGKVAENMPMQWNGVDYTFNQLAQEEASRETQRQALKAFQENVIANGGEIVGIAGFGNSVKVDKLSEEEVTRILSTIAENTSQLDKFETEYAETAVKTAALMYQNNYSADNAYAIKMGSSYGSTDSSLQKEFDARSTALMVQASTAEVSQALIDQYASIVEQYSEGVNGVTYENVLAIQEQLANATSYNNMRKGLQGVFEDISEVVEEYEKLASLDFVGKINVANEALSRYGIQVTSAADADLYMGLLEQLTQGSTTALAQIVAFAQESAGLSVEAFGNAYTQGWEIISAEQEAFFNTMAQAQLGRWETVAGQGKKFVWATAGELQSIAEAAGTAFEAWENPYSWLYNYNEQINKLTREREKLERRYSRLLEQEGASAQELLKTSQEQLANLKEEAAIQEQSAKNAIAVINGTFSKNKQFAKYAQFDATTGSITIDYAGLDKAGFDSDKGSEFEEFLSIIEENRDVLLDAEESLADIEDDIKEIKERGKDETSDLYDAIKEGMVQSRQNEIDELESINSSIQEAQSALVDQMQKQIEEQRQSRENKETENDIADQETRLAYLMQNSSGGNQKEIEALRKSITESKQSYTDSLVDQQLDSLQDANEKAAEQRQQQIDIAQAQLNAYSKSQAIWNDVKGILDTSLRQTINGDNFEQEWLNTQAGTFASMANGIEELNPIEADQLKQELTNNAKLASLYTGVTTIEGTSKTLAQEAQETTEAVGQVNTSVQDIKNNAGQFGKIGNTELKEGVQGITDGVEASQVTTRRLISGIDGEVSGLVETDEFKSGFNRAIDVNVVSGVSTSGGESSFKEGSKDAAIQKGITAMASFRSGGAGSVTDSDAWIDAEDAYVAAGGRREDFYNVVAGNVRGTSKDHDKYDYGAHYDSKQNLITTGTFPNSWTKGLGNGTGKGDVFDVHFKDLNGTVYGVNNAEIDMTDKVSDTVGNAINSLYGSKVSPQTGWIVLYADTPYIYYEGSWRSFYKKGNELKEQMKQYLNPHYKDGGLADFTGPAWLDGTKSKPEIVLNQSDSANFMQLRDILADILHGTSGLSKTDKEGNSGDNYYDIAINVDSLENDYDVEQLANKIRSMIYEDSMYRNVNSINGLR